ncbi:hypothetical protein [Timonella senegalensis]|uniref:hypothetical protein n=1 Tax=Timonella senegalensis TaxID=1465825 RepID=UPI002FDD99A0
MFGFVSVAMISVALTDGPIWLHMILLGWLAAYCVARGMANDGTQLISNVGLFLAVWSIVEFATGFHPFSDIAASGNWGAIQIRGTWERSEASLGHAIALGGVVAGSIPFALNRQRFKYLYVVVMLAGVVSTLSRGPIAAALIALVVWTVTNNRTRSKLLTLLLALVSAVAAFTLFQEVASSGDVEELGRSAGARSIQLEETFGLIEPFGTVASSQTSQAFGTQVFGSIAVIDSFPLFLGLYVGAVPTVLFIFLLAAVTWGVFRTNSAASVSIVAAFPIMLVTSPITQWQFFLFFIIGLAVRGPDSQVETIEYESSSSLGGSEVTKSRRSRVGRRY